MIGGTAMRDASCMIKLLWLLLLRFLYVDKSASGLFAAAAAAATFDDNDPLQHHFDPARQERVTQRGPNPNGYPWSVSHFDQRQSSILEDFRDNMEFDISEEVLPKKLMSSLDDSNSVYSPLAYIVRNIEADIFYGSLFSSKRDKHNKERQKRLKEQDRGQSGQSRGGRFSEVVDLANEDDVLAALSPECAYLQNGFWNYEWCHKHEVRQFHLRQPDNPTLNDPRHPHHVQGMREPDWSLGKYHSTRTHRKGGVNSNTTAPINKVVSLFVDGQFCDENSKKRSTEVHIECCSEISLNNSPKNSKKTPKDFAPVFIKSVSEPDICMYKIEACCKLLCEEADLAPLVKSTSLTAILKEFENHCIVKAEEWWTYELCFKTGLRQMHLVVESTKQVDNAVVQTQSIQVQYSLGKAPTHLYSDESALSSQITNFRLQNKTTITTTTTTTETVAESTTETQPSQLDRVYGYVGMPSNIIMGRKKKPDALVLQFTNGTVCDIKNGVQRTASVFLYCGEKEMIAEIIESRTCHYDVVVYVNEICRYPAMTPKVSTYRHMKYYAAFEMDFHDFTENDLSPKSTHEEFTGFGNLQ